MCVLLVGWQDWLQRLCCCSGLQMGCRSDPQKWIDVRIVLLVKMVGAVIARCESSQLKAATPDPTLPHPSFR